RRLLAAIVEGPYLAIELLHGGGKRRSQAEVGKVPGTVADLYGAYAQRQGRGAAGGRSGGLRLWHEQFADVGAAILVDHEADIGLFELHRLDTQTAAMPVGNALQGQAWPFDEVALAQGVEGMQLVDVG